jgi:hypothetical protein
MKRREFLPAIAAASVPWLSGCLTQKLMAKSEENAYVETVSFFLISKDGNNIAVLGDKYHYIFDAPVSLVRTLQSPIRQVLFGHTEPFEVAEDQTVSGNYSIHLKNEATEHDKAQARAIGFTQDQWRRLHIRGRLKGKRYSAANFQLDRIQKQKFNQPYRVKVYPERSAADSAKLLLTPITVMADGVIILGTQALLIVVLPIAFMAADGK